MLRVYADQLAGPVPTFPVEIEEGIDQYLSAMPPAVVTAAPGGPASVRD